MIAQWFHQFPVYVQFILALVMTDWLGFQCVSARHILEEPSDE